MNMLFINYIHQNLQKFVDLIELDSEESKTDGILRIYVRNEHLLFVSTFLKLHTNTQYKQLMDVSVVDYPNKLNRFEFLHHFSSPYKNRRLLVKSALGLNKSTYSLSSLYHSSIWMEREVGDLFGVFFYNHPDLRRILTDYGFEGYPLRKDFPMTGYLELRYDDEKKRVVQEPLEISQEFRAFDFISPWEKK